MSNYRVTQDYWRGKSGLALPGFPEGEIGPWFPGEVVALSAEAAALINVDAPGTLEATDDPVRPWPGGGQHERYVAHARRRQRNGQGQVVDA
jgi:hypothetical protein